jgi:hypothetical protein
MLIESAIRNSVGAIRCSQGGMAPTFSSGITGLVPASSPTDIAALLCGNYSRSIFLRRVSISATADAAAVIDVLLQRSSNGGGGTSTSQNIAAHDMQDYPAQGLFYAFTANRSSNGDGVSSTRPIIRAGKLLIGTSTSEAPPLTWDFPREKAPRIGDLVKWLAVNCKGQTLPANTRINIDVEWHEEALPRIAFAGDSTFSNATYLFYALGFSGYLNSIAAIENLGSNGFRLQDYLLHTNGVTYAQGGGSGVLNHNPDILVMGYGINDVRAGGASQAQLISMLDAAIYATLNGTTSGATYTSNMGAQTTFTWPATIPASPDCKIILWGPNSFTSDDPGSTGYVTNTGTIAGADLAEAAQNATNILYNAYQAFEADCRIFALVQRQKITGRIVQTNAQNGGMTDIMHPNQRRQTQLGRQLAPTLRDAISIVNGILI